MGGKFAIYLMLFSIASLSTVAASNTTTYYDRWHINEKLGLHSGTDPDARFGNWSKKYNGSETGTYLRAGLFLEQQNISVLNVIMRVESGLNHKDNITTFLGILDDNNISLDVIIDYEPNVTENRSIHIASLKQVINDSRKNDTHFYPNVVGISIDYEWLDGINKSLELNDTVEEARNITVNNSLLFFPIWFEDNIRDAIVNISNKTDVIPLYDGLIDRKTDVNPDFSNSYTNDRVAHMKSNGFNLSGILPVSSETGSLKKRRSVALKTWIVYYNAATLQNLSYSILASGNALDEDPLEIFTTDAIVETHRFNGTVHDVPDDNFTNDDKVFLYGALPRNKTTYELHVVNNQSFSNQTSLPSRSARFNTSITTNNRSFFIMNLIIHKGNPGNYDVVIDVDNDSIYDEALDALDDQDTLGAGFKIANVLFHLRLTDPFQMDKRNVTSHNNLSRLVNTSLSVKGVYLSYNGTKTRQRPFGKLYDDFSVLHFHLFNKTSNTLADLILTDDGFILRALNLSYKYKNTGDDELQLRRKTENVGNGSDFSTYDYMGLKVNADIAHKHKMKFRITAANETNSSREVHCDTPYRTILKTGWIDFTASMNEMSAGCNISDVHMVSLFVNDHLNSDTDQGHILLDELYLRKNLYYYFDDFEQYLLNDSPNWGNISGGYNVSFSIVNTTSNNGTQSLNISYNYSAGSSNFSVLRNDLPFSLDINNYETIGFYFKADIAGLHNVTAVVYDNASKSCASPVQKAGKAGWAVFEWNISDLGSGCNLSFITGPALNISQGNDSQPVSGQVYIDEYFLKSNVSERIEFNFINESLRVNATVGWKICVNASFDNCSISQEFNFTQYPIDSGATYGTDTGNLTQYLNSLNRLQKNTQKFRIANRQEREFMGNIIKSLASLNYAGAIANASAIDHTITNFTHNKTLPNRTYYVVEHSGKNRGWGYYIFYPAASISDLIVSIPHPLNDANTRTIGSDLYLNVSTEWMLLASAHRDTNFNEIAEPVSDDNRQHPYFAVMLNLTNSSSRWLDVHGFAIASHPDHPNVTLSSGNSSQSALTLSFANNLSAINLLADVFNGSNYPNLAGTRNVIGKHVRSLGAEFIHSEISNTVRNNRPLIDSYIKAALNTFNPIDGDAPTVSLTAPGNNTGDNDGNVTFLYTVTDASKVSNCSLVLNSIVNITNTSITTTISQNFSLSAVAVGRYNWSVNCTDSSGNAGASTQRIVHVVPASRFSGKTTDLSNVNISNISNLIVEEPTWGAINFSGFTNLHNNTDINSHINISSNRISLNASVLAHLNKTATLRLYNLTFSDPRILRDGVVCPDDICIKITYSNGNLTFNVSHFSVYSAEETPSSTSTSSGGGGSGGSSGSGGGGGAGVYRCGDGRCDRRYKEACASDQEINEDFGPCFKDCGICKGEKPERETPGADFNRTEKLPAPPVANNQTTLQPEEKRWPLGVATVAVLIAINAVWISLRATRRRKK